MVSAATAAAAAAYIAYPDPIGVTIDTSCTEAQLLAAVS